MKKLYSMMAAVALASGLLTGASAQAANDKATVTVIHGISGLPQAVDVYANGTYLFSFDFKDVAGPLELDPGTYDLEVKLAGNTVLSASASVEAGKNYTVIAHFTYVEGGDPGIQLSVFENAATGTGAGQTRLTVRHTADAPAVDIKLFRGGGKKLSLGVEDAANPQQVGPVLIRPGAYRAELFVANTDVRAFKSGKLVLNPHKSYIVYAIGSVSAGTIDLLPQEIDTGK
jgi:hypothetical protein